MTKESATNMLTSWNGVRPLDLLASLHCVLAFDKKGTSVSVEKRIAKCQRTMASIARNAGMPERTDGAISLHPEARTLQARRRAMRDLVATYCRVCGLNVQNGGDCTGAVSADLVELRQSGG